MIDKNSELAEVPISDVLKTFSAKSYSKLITRAKWQVKRLPSWWPGVPSSMKEIRETLASLGAENIDEIINSRHGDLIDQLVALGFSLERDSGFKKNKNANNFVERKLDQKLAQPITDKPADKDLLGRSSLIHVLKGIIDRDENKHLIIALFARWGSGKSSVIELLNKKYQQSKETEIIIFNAWRDEHSLSMPAAVANSIIKNLYSGRSITEKVMLNITRSLLKERFSIAILLLLIVVILVYSIAFKLTGYIVTDHMYVISAIGGLTTLRLLIKSLFNNSITKKIRNLAKKSDFSSSVGLMGEIRDDIKTLLEIYPPNFRNIYSTFIGKNGNNNTRYLLVVDDLDRCSDKKIVAMLETIQLMIDIDNVSVLLAVDQEVLLSAVASKYRDPINGIDNYKALFMAREFLGKIFQITVTLEEPSNKRKKEFVIGKLYRNVKFSSSIEASEAKLNNKHILAGNFNSLETEEDLGYEELDEYLIDSEAECKAFIVCTGVFSISNPRTLIRIHNSLTLMKGLYPEIIGDDKVIDIYILFSFWFEFYFSASRYQKVFLEEIMKGDDLSSASSMLNEIDGLFKKMDLHLMSHIKLEVIKSRVKNVTLPFIRDPFESEGLSSSSLDSEAEDLEYN